MSEYLIDLTADQQQVLRGFGIGFVTTTYGTKRFSSIVEEDFTNALTALSMKALYFEKTSLDYIRIAHLISAHEFTDDCTEKLFATRIYDSAVPDFSSFARIVRQFQQFIKVGVVVHFMDGHVHETANDDSFHIFIYSSSVHQVQETATPPQMIWGQVVNSRTDAYRSVPLGREPIIDTETGWVVAEYSANNLSIHHDLFTGDTSTPDEDAIFEHLLMEEIVPRISPQARLERELARANARRAASRTNFAIICVGDVPGEIADSERVLAQHIEEANRTTQALAIARQNKREAEANQDAGVDPFEVRFGEEYDQIMAIPQVKRIEITGEKIILFTNMIRCKDNRTGRYHLLGEFKIQIDISQTEPARAFVWENLTHGRLERADGHIAPHVQSPTNACWGSSHSVFTKHLRDHAYLALIMYTISFLETANIHDAWGKLVEYWPVDNGRRR